MVRELLFLKGFGVCVKGCVVHKMYELLHRIGDELALKREMRSSKCGNTFEAINTNTSERCVVRRERLSRITFKSEGKQMK